MAGDEIETEPEVDGFPERQARDVVRDVAEAGLSMIPFGSGVAKLIEIVFEPSLSRRQVEWHRYIDDLVRRLDEKQVTPEDLASDEVWISALMEASRVAVGTHVESKLEMLQNLLERMAIDKPRSGDQVIVRRFLKFIEELDEEHFLLLKYASDPTAWFDFHDITKPNISTGPRRAILEVAGLRIDGQALDIIMQDLGQRSLLDVGGFTGGVTAGSLYDPLSTSLGNELLRWITAFE